MSKRKCFHLNCTVLLNATVPATYFIIIAKIEMLARSMLVIVLSICKVLPDSEETN